MSVFWTPEEDERLRRSVACQMSRKRMAEYVGRTVSACGNRRIVLGLNPASGRSCWSPEETMRLINGYKSGLRRERLAAHVGRSVKACNSKLPKVLDSLPILAPKLEEPIDIGARKREREHIARLLADGGFPRWSEFRTERGAPRLCPPLLKMEDAA